MGKYYFLNLYRRILPYRLREIIGRARLAIGKNYVHTYDGDGFTSNHFLGFRSDLQFQKAFKIARDSLPADYPHGYENTRNLEYRAHICTWAANQALNVARKIDGKVDFVECGTWYGLLSKTIVEYLDFRNLNGKFYLVDTYGYQPGSHPHPNYQKDIFENVTKRFSTNSNIKLIRGIVPDVLDKITSTKIAYLAIDMNSYKPELATLEYFYPKLIQGGVIYLDDYGWHGYEKLREVVDKFFENKPDKLLHFPSGNSIIVKS